MGQLTVAVDDALAHDLQRRAAGGTEFGEFLAALGVRLSPLHPGTLDPELGRWFFADVPDEAAVEQILTRLINHPRVVAAYVKPPDAMP